MSSGISHECEYANEADDRHVAMDFSQPEHEENHADGGTFNSLLQELDKELSNKDTMLSNEDEREREDEDESSTRQLAGVCLVKKEDALEKDITATEKTSDINNHDKSWEEASCQKDLGSEDTEGEFFGQKSLKTAWEKKDVSDSSIVHNRIWSSGSVISSEIPEQDQGEESELSHGELHRNTITDTAERLALIFGDETPSNSNSPVLENILRNADKYALDEIEKPQEKVVFTIESTKPLFPTDNSGQILFEVQVNENSKDAENEVLQTKNAHEVSKLPIVSNFSINTFVNKMAPTRVSSGSSIEDIQEELNTSRIDDQYNLLSSEQKHQLPELPQFSPSPPDYRVTSIQNLQNKNSSRILSVATTADIYQSAKEFETKSNATVNNLSDDASVEDLKILEECELPPLPTLSTFQLNPNPIIHSSSMETVKMGDISLNGTTDEKLMKNDVTTNSSYPFTSSYEEKNHRVSIEEGIVSKDFSEHSSTVDNGDSTNEVINQNLSFLLPEVSRSNELSTIFNDDLFNTQEFSFEEIDMTRKPKDINYLSIWHSQEETIRVTSPATSSNSQFSAHSEPSSTTTAQSYGSSRFKSRVISRSQIRPLPCVYGSAEDGVINVANKDSKLDPMRRDTLLSRRIQQEIKMHEKLHPLGIPLVAAQKDECEEYDVQTSGNLEDGEVSHSLPDFETQQPDFSSFIEKIANDEEYREDTLLKTRCQSNVPVLHGWSTDSYVEPLINDDNAVKERMLAKILQNVDEDITIGQIQQQNMGVMVQHEIDGIKVSRSFSSLSSKSTKHTPLKHVHSPFKVLQPKQATAPPSIFTKSPTHNKISFGHSSESNGVDSMKTFEESNVDNINQELPDKGRLYIKLKEISSLKFKGIKMHKAKYCVEFDNGNEVIDTPWESVPEDGSIPLNKEMEIFLNSNISTLTITIKIQHTRPESQLVEISERIPIKKKFPFSKPKYRTVKRFDTKKVEYDEWDYLFAKDGSYARCQIELNRSMLEKMEYREISSSIEMVNEWARKVEKKDTIGLVDIWELPRAPPHPVCNLEFDVVYLPRVSPLERFPKSLDAVKKCCEKYKEQQSLSAEGFLWQEGGDVDGLMKKRFYKLKGTDLIAHDAATKKPIILLNLLNVVDIYVDGRSISGKKIRNFTDVVLLNDCFKLLFSNDEIINFNTDSKLSKEKWVETLRNVVELNKFHQPWIKKLTSSQNDDSFELFK